MIIIDYRNLVNVHLSLFAIMGTKSVKLRPPISFREVGCPGLDERQCSTLV
jgi:hypothetical protein